jgi:hypothetical protein
MTRMAATEITALLEHAATYEPTAVVRARRLPEGATWLTDRGAPMQAEAGDWELTDDSGGRWTVQPETFARSYRRLLDGRYAKVERVNAVQLTSELQVPTAEGVSPARAGDWLLRDADGAVWPVPDETFRARYRPVDATP